MSTVPPENACLIHELLPYELISQILAWAAIAPSSIKDRYCAARILQSVCRMWQDISISTPELWTSLRAGISMWPDSAAESARRSANLPLEIHLELRNGDVELGKGIGYPGPRMGMWMVLFKEHASRIRKTHVDIHQDLKKPGIVLDILLRALPKATTVSASSAHTIACLFKNYCLPRFRSLDLECHGFRSWSDLGQSCRDMEEVRLIECSTKAWVLAPDLRRFLAELRNVRVLELGNKDIIMPLHQMQAAELGRLERLVIRDFGGDSVASFFKLFAAPQLKFLTIVGGRYLKSSPPGEISSQFPALEVLTLDQCPCALELAGIHSLVATQVTLSFDDGDILLNDLCALWEKSPQILPLETLTTRGMSAIALARLGGMRSLLPSLRQVFMLDDGRILNLPSGLQDD